MAREPAAPLSRAPARRPGWVRAAPFVVAAPGRAGGGAERTRTAIPAPVAPRAMAPFSSPRHADVPPDPYQHLNHARAVTLLEEARIALFFGRATADGLGGFAAGLLVAGLGVEYRAQVAYRAEPLCVTMTVEAVRAASFTIRYALHDGPAEGDPVAITAETRMATVDLAAARPRRLTAPEREWLGRWAA
jgi:acyl-CoA thioester hydrolase